MIEKSDKENLRSPEEALFPAFVLGLVNRKGPFDAEDRELAERLLKITETREALLEIFPRGVDDDIWQIAQLRRAYFQEIITATANL